MKNIEKWAERLGVDVSAPHDDDGFYTACPCHQGPDPSELHVYVGHKGNIFMRCHVCGATGASVCAKLNVPVSELAADEPSDHEVQGSSVCDLDSVTKRIVKHMCRTNGKTYGYEDLRCAVVWLESFEVAAYAVCMMAEHITGRRDTVSDELVRTLVNSFADRLGSKVMQMLNDEVEASTPEVPE